MNNKNKLYRLADLAKDLDDMGFKSESKKISKFILLKTANIDVDFINSVKEKLGNNILEMEYYPPGSGIFTNLNEFGFLFSDLNKEAGIRMALSEMGFSFKALMDSAVFSSTILGSSSSNNIGSNFWAIIATI